MLIFKRTVRKSLAAIIQIQKNASQPCIKGLEIRMTKASGIMFEMLALNLVINSLSAIQDPPTRVLLSEL